MSKFEIELQRHRVVAGFPINEVLGAELRAAAIGRYLLITSDELSVKFDSIAGADALRLKAGRFKDVVAHVPESTVAKALSAVQECMADGIVAFGGGSALDTAKAVSDRSGKPIIAIPTNFSGSEVTWNYGLTVDGVKRTMRNRSVLPVSVLYDPSLIVTLPARVAVCSGINAVAHAVEAIYAPHANPLTHALAETGIRKTIDGLRGFVASGGSSIDAAESCFAGSWLCGEVLSQVGMGLHHRICHVLGGTYGLPHAEVHTVMLPYTVEWNVKFAPALLAFDSIFPGTSFAKGIADFSISHGAPASLGELGLAEGQIAEVAALALSSPVDNPRPTTQAELEALIGRAYAGEQVSRSARLQI